MPLTVNTSTILQEHKTYSLAVRESDTIVIPASEHQFHGHPFLHAFYQKHPSVTILYIPDFRNPYPYGYDDDGNIFFHLRTPFTGDIVLACMMQTVDAAPSVTREPH